MAGDERNNDTGFFIYLILSNPLVSRLIRTIAISGGRPRITTMHTPLFGSLYVMFLFALLSGCTGGGERGTMQGTPAENAPAIGARTDSIPAAKPAPADSSHVTLRPDFEKFFAKYGAEGCFVMYDLKEGSYVRYNPARCDEGFLPASTFKIFNSLVALETGVAPDEHMILRWDGVKRGGAWDEDHDMRMAFKNSTVWYYKEIARRIGEKRMQYYIDREGYGNRNIGGGIDAFWLNGEMRITANQQIELLKKLHAGELGFSKRTMEIVRDIMEIEKTRKYTLRGKTGWAQGDFGNVGWLVGWVEKGDDVYFFATNISSTEEDFPMVEARKYVTYGILRSLIGLDIRG